MGNKGPLRPFTSIHRPDLFDPWPFPIHSISFLVWGWDQGPGDWQPSWGHPHLGLLLANNWVPWKHWSWEIPARRGTSPMGHLCLETLRRPGPSFSELHCGLKLFLPNPSIPLSFHRCQTALWPEGLSLSTPVPFPLSFTGLSPSKSVKCLILSKHLLLSLPPTHLTVWSVDCSGSLSWPEQELSTDPGNGSRVGRLLAPPTK